MTVVLAKAAAALAPVTDDSPFGAFEAILSAPTVDRDGDRLAPDGWKTPLPEHIPVNVDHSMSTVKVVGSGQPFLAADGTLRIRGSFASTDLGQQTRTLVNEGHMRTLSVEYLEHPDGKRELTGAGFVYLPSNRESKVLSSKAARDVLAYRAKAVDPTSVVSDLVDPSVLAAFVDLVDSLPTLSDDDLPPALDQVTQELAALCASIHDAASDGVDDTPAATPDDDPRSGAADGANKSANLVSLRVRALVAALGQPT